MSLGEGRCHAHNAPSQLKATMSAMEQKPLRKQRLRYRFTVKEHLRDKTPRNRTGKIEDIYFSSGMEGSLKLASSIPQTSYPIENLT